MDFDLSVKPNSTTKKKRMASNLSNNGGEGTVNSSNNEHEMSPGRIYNQKTAIKRLMGS